MARRQRATPPDAPTLGYIQARVEQAKRTDGDRNTLFDRIETLRHRRHVVEVPPAFQSTLSKQVKISLIDETLRTVVSNIGGSFPVASEPPTGVGAQAQAATTKVEKWVNALLAKLDAVSGGHRPYQDALDHGAMFGLGVHKLLYKPDAWDNSVFRRRPKEEDTVYTKRVTDYERTAPVPFTWQAIDPRTFHPTYEDGELIEVVQISKRPRFELADRYSETVYYDDKAGLLKAGRLGTEYAESALGSSAYSEDVDFVEHWLRRDGKCWVTYLADGVILDQFDTGYPRLPFFPFFGLFTSSRSPEFEATSVVSNMLDTVEALDTLLTAWLHWAYRTAMPMGVYTPGPTGGRLLDAVGNPLDVIPWEPGVMKVLPPDSKWQWMTSPGIGQDVEKLSTMLLDLTDRASSVPGILKGEMDRDIPAWGMAQLFMAARRIYNPITDNCSLALAAMCNFALELLEKKHKRPIYILGSNTESKVPTRKWLSLSPSDVDGYYAVSVEINALTEDKRIQEGQFGLSLFQSGVISLRELLETYLHYSSPEEMIAELMAEKFRNSDKYMQWIFDRAWQRLLPGEAQAAGATPEEQAALGQLPPAQMPGAEQIPPEVGQPGLPAGPEGMPGGVQPIAGMPSPQAPVPGGLLPLTQPTPPGLPAV